MALTLQQLIDQSQDGFLSYQDLLKAEEWKLKRQEIIIRDGYRCSTCGAAETTPHFDEGSRKTIHIRFIDSGNPPKIEVADKSYHFEVHHKLYVLNKLPWLYDNGDLTTLCNWCHWKFHEDYKVPVYSQDEKNIIEFGACSRCNGVGGFPQYSHVEGGVCFRCHGARYEIPLVKYNFKKR